MRRTNGCKTEGKKEVIKRRTEYEILLVRFVMMIMMMMIIIIVTRNLKKNFEAVPGKNSIDSLQNTAILGTSHTIRKVLQCEA